MSLLLLALLAADPPSSAYVQIRNQGVLKGSARSINCSGSGVTCAVNTTTAEATLTVNIVVSDAGNGTNWDGGPAIPACAAGFVLDGDGGSLYCTNVIATATALAANPTDCSANNYATAIAASGNLTCAQVNYNQLAGSPVAGGSSPQVQYNSGGFLAGVPNVTSDGTNVIYATLDTAPSAPSAGVTPYQWAPFSSFPSFATSIDTFTGIPVPSAVSSAFIGTTGGWWSWGCSVSDHAGGGLDTYGAEAAPSASAWASTATFKADSGLLTDIAPWQVTGLSNASNVSGTITASALKAWRGNRAGHGGFIWWGRVALTTTLSHVRLFFGLLAGASISSTLEPAVNTQTIYIGADNNDSNLHACGNGATGDAGCVDLGSNFPAASATNVVYDIWLAAAPNASSVSYYVRRLDSLQEASGTISTKLPDNSVQLKWLTFINTADAGTAEVARFYGMCWAWNW